MSVYQSKNHIHTSDREHYHICSPRIEVLYACGMQRLYPFFTLIINHIECGTVCEAKIMSFTQKSYFL
jgi:hypothetical protein